MSAEISNLRLLKSVELLLKSIVCCILTLLFLFLIVNKMKLSMRLRNTTKRQDFEVEAVEEFFKKNPIVDSLFDNPPGTLRTNMVEPGSQWAMCCCVLSIDMMAFEAKYCRPVYWQCRLSLLRALVSRIRQDILQSVYDGSQTSGGEALLKHSLDMFRHV